MPWTGGINTSADPGVISSQDLVQADNVVFSSTGARTKREALEYLDNDIPAPDERSSSGTVRTLVFYSEPLVTYSTVDQRLVVGEKITVTGNNDYAVIDTTVVSITPSAEVTEVTCVADVDGSLAGKYFLISAGDAGEDFYVWYKVSGVGTDPEVTARSGVEVAISTNDSASAVAAATAAALTALDAFTATSLSEVVTITCTDAGYCFPPALGTLAYTPCIQDFEFNPGPAVSGQITAEWDGNTIATLEADDSAAEIQTKIREYLAPFEDITVTGSFGGVSPVTITMTGVTTVTTPFPAFTFSANSLVNDIATPITVNATIQQDFFAGFEIEVITEGSITITYEAEEVFNEALTAAGDIVVARASKVLWAHDYWRYSTDQINEQLLVYATADFQLFTLDENKRRIQILGQEQVSEVTVDAASSITSGEYFLVNGPGNETNYYVWYNKDGAGGDPAVSGRTAIPVAILAADTASQVATKTATAIDANADFSSTADVAVVTITAARAGITSPTLAGTSGFTINTVSYGATMPTEQLTTVRMLTFNESLQVYFSGSGNYPVLFNPDENSKYQLFVPNTAAVDGIAMPDASFAFLHLGRVWCNDKARRDYIHYSETYDETLWLGFSDSGALIIFPGDGDPQGITNGYVYKGFAVIGKQAARYRILGDSPENFQVQPISSGMGNEGAFSVAVDETDAYFISKRGIHSQAATDAYGDTDAAYLSAKIKGSFNDFEASQLKYIQGAYIPELNSVAFSICEDGEQSQQDVWLYNFEVQPPEQNPGVWYRWPNISCTALNRRFTNNKYKLVFGTASGRIIQAQKENDYSDFGTTGISYVIKTGTIYPGNDPQSMKLFKRITMIYRPKGNFNFGVMAKIDNHEQQSFSFNEVSGLDLLGESFILGSSILGSANTLAPFTYTMDGYGRGITLTISQPSADEQIEVWGFTIEYENAELQQETT